jgi:hypothetical protein
MGLSHRGAPMPWQARWQSGYYWTWVIPITEGWMAAVVERRRRDGCTAYEIFLAHDDGRSFSPQKTFDTFGEAKTEAIGFALDHFINTGTERWELKST